MAKKSSKRRPQPSRRPAAAKPQATAGAKAAPAAVAVQAAPEQPAPDLAGEYRYVLSDLRRVGILAAVMFALLIVTALVAQFVIG